MVRSMSWSRRSISPTPQGRERKVYAGGLVDLWRWKHAPQLDLQGPALRADGRGCVVGGQPHAGCCLVRSSAVAQAGRRWICSAPAPMTAVPVKDMFTRKNVSVLWRRHHLGAVGDVDDRDVPQ